jgi:hypothetical protein
MSIKDVQGLCRGCTSTQHDTSCMHIDGARGILYARRWCTRCPRFASMVRTSCICSLDTAQCVLHAYASRLRKASCMGMHIECVCAHASRVCIDTERGVWRACTCRGCARHPACACVDCVRGILCAHQSCAASTLHNAFYVRVHIEGTQGNGRAHAC